MNSSNSTYDRIDYEWRITHNGEGKTPNMRCNSACWVYKECIWMVCGSGAGLGKSSEVWRFFLGAEKRWDRVKCSGDPPSCRDGHSWTYVGGGKFVIFGGQGFPAPNNKLGKGADSSRVQTYFKREVYNDLFLFDCETCTWTPIYPNGLNSPMGRRGHSAIYINRSQPFASSQTPHTPAHTASNTHHHSSAVNNSLVSVSSTHSIPASVSSSAISSVGGNSVKLTQRSHNNRDNHGGIDVTLVPPNSILVFGGSGIELSKYTEQIYNDVWIFCLDTNCWSRHEAARTGVDPKPVFDHRAEKVGNYMVVVGGITGTPKSSHIQDYAAMSDVMLMNLKTFTWSYLKLWDRHGRPSKFNFHGFSMCSDFQNNPNGLFIFGGREVVDSKVASMSKINPPSQSSHAAYNTFFLNISDGSLTPVKLREDSSIAMENRFGHMGVSAVSVDVIHQHFDNAAKPKKPDKMKPQRRILDPLKQLPIKVDPILYVFGGSTTERGGFCDPVLMELVKIQSCTENPYIPFTNNVSLESGDLFAGSMPPSSPPTGVLHVSFAMNKGDSSTLGLPKSPFVQFDLLGNSSMGLVEDMDYGKSSQSLMEGSFLEEQGGGPHGSLNKASKPKSIWYNMQLQVHQSAGQSSAANAASSLVLKQPSNWIELKLALTSPLSMRRFENSLPVGTAGGTGMGNSRSGGDILGPYSNNTHSGMNTAHLKKLRLTKSSPELLLQSQLAELYSNTGNNGEFSAFRRRNILGNSLNTSTHNNYHSSGSASSSSSTSSFDNLGSISRTGSAGGIGGEGSKIGTRRPLTPQQQHQQQQQYPSRQDPSTASESSGEGDLLVDENRGDSRDMRVKMLAATLGPIIRHKTKVDAKKEFTRLLPSLSDSIYA